MAITASQLLFFASETMSDADTGGGPISALNIQDGVQNRLFEGVTSADATTGRLQLRKVYAAVASADSDVLSGVRVAVHAMPSDAALDVVAFAASDVYTSGDAVADDGSGRIVPIGTQAGDLAQRSAVAGFLARFPLTYVMREDQLSSLTGTTVDVITTETIEIGDYVAFTSSTVFPTSVASGETLPTLRNIGVVTALTSTTTGVPGETRYTLTSSGGMPASILSPRLELVVMRARWSATGLLQSRYRCCGLATLTAGVSAAATVLPVSRVMAKVVPFSGSTYPATAIGISPTLLSPTQGRVPIFHEGQQVLIRHVSNPALSEQRTIERVYFDGRLKLTAGLTNAYPSGSFVSSLVDLQDLQAQVGASFAQQTWTRVFSDALIGNGISASYNRTTAPIVAQNIGAITQRWALVFTSSTEYEAYGEFVGKIANGSIGTAFSPANPRTATPYFTVPAAGWGSGWLRGNVLRFNTTAATGGLWVARCISPGATTAAGSVTLQMRGSVNA